MGIEITEDTLLTLKKEFQMSVVTVDVTLKVPKEGKEVVDAVSGIIGHFRKGGDLAGAAAYLPAVMAAVEGNEKLPEEIKSQHKNALAAYTVEKVWGSLEAPPVTPA